jgi:MIP family channel proteins
MNDGTKHALAELIGTFTLVFIGAGAGAMDSTAKIGIVGVALAHGIALTVIVYAWGPISGAHVNPAVTFGIAIAGKMDWGKAAMYWAAQLVGAALAAYLLMFLIGKGGADSVGKFADAATIGEFSKAGGKDYNATKTVVVEAVLTFFLVTAVFGSAVAGRNGNAFGLAIGLVLTMDILCGGALTGASMNPARSFGPAMALGEPSYLWMYFVGPLVGGGAAGLVYSSLFLDGKKK